MDRLMTGELYLMSVCICSSSVGTDYHSLSPIPVPSFLSQVPLPISIPVSKPVGLKCAQCRPLQKRRHGATSVALGFACGNCFMRISTFIELSRSSVKLSPVAIGQLVEAMYWCPNTSLGLNYKWNLASKRKLFGRDDWMMKWRDGGKYYRNSLRLIEFWM